MENQGTLSNTVLLCQLEGSLADELQAVLAHRTIGFATEHCSDLADLPRKWKETQAEMIFCSFSENLLSLGQTLQIEGRRVPMIVVSRHPDTVEWLDSMEAGAADYCAAPFELPHVRWIVNSNTKSLLTTAA